MASSQQRVYKSRLLAAQQRKKAAERDSQLLANRLQLLKQEEARTWRKIQQTKKRAAEIVRLREENQRRMQERMEHALRMEAEAKAMRDKKNASGDARARFNRMKWAEEQQMKRRGEVQAMRREKRRLKEEADQAREREVARARQKRDRIQREQQELKRRQDKAREDRIRSNREAYERRVVQEERETRKKETDVAKMEKLEMELIQRLRNTQLLQRQAYEELEGALSASPTAAAAASTSRSVGGGSGGGSGGGGRSQSAKGSKK